MPTSPAREGAVDVEAIRALVDDWRNTEVYPWRPILRQVLDALAASEAARQEAREALRDALVGPRGRVDLVRFIDSARAALDSGHQEGASHLEGERE